MEKVEGIMEEFLSCFELCTSGTYQLYKNDYGEIIGWPMTGGCVVLQERSKEAFEFFKSMRDEGCFHEEGVFIIGGYRRGDCFVQDVLATSAAIK